MDAVVRTVAMYLFLLLIFRIAGRRTLSEMNTFDFVLLIVVGEASQQALTGPDFSFTNAVVIISTLVLLNVGFSLAKRAWPRLDKVMEGVPTVLVENGRPIRDIMVRARVEEDDVLESARKSHGLARMSQIKYAVLERNGEISIIPMEKS